MSMREPRRHFARGLRPRRERDRALAGAGPPALSSKCMVILQRLPVDDALLASFCTRWKVAKLELFGSMIADPSNARDIDLLVTFAPDARWGLFEHERMERELSGLLGRRVDLVSRRAIESSGNLTRRNSILASAVPVYVSG
jgi:uncharacterized protein